MHSTISSPRSESEAQAPEFLDLVDRARIGDLEAQSELVRRYTPRISGFVRPMLGQPSSVEDVVQVIFIKMVRRLRLLRSSGAFESWLFRLARNTALDFIRRRRCRPFTVADETEIERTADTSSERAVGEIMEAFEIAIRRLNPIDQNLVRMIVQGHSYTVAAEQAGLTVGAVKVRLCRVRPFLRSSVGGEAGVRLPDQAVFSPPRRRVARAA
ncbi:MAG TPA: sigma-70 family RNA polymerase sigma factor [Opitutaceae bacterium]|nr:sigma-70 family RNA polymerase sigma factor [Opitutaceae bacterium]